MKKDILDPIFRYDQIIDEVIKQEQQKTRTEEFELRGLLREAMPLSKTTSVLTVLTKDGEVKLKNNKSTEYWKRQRAASEDAVIKGRRPHESAGVSQVYYVTPGRYDDIKKSCHANDQSTLTAMFNQLDPHFVNSLIQTAANTDDYPVKEDASRSLVASTYEELVATFKLLKNKYPPDVRHLADHYFKMYPKAASDEKERIRKRLYFLVNYYHGVSNTLLQKDPDDVYRCLEDKSPGQKHIKEVLCQKFRAFLRDPMHRAPKVLIHASEKYGLVRLVELFFETCGLPYDEHSVCGSTDNANLQGSSAIYSNASLGSFAEKLAMKGIGGFIIKDIDLFGSEEGAMPIASMAGGKYYNELLEHPVCLESEFIVFTARDLDKIPFDTSGLTVLEPCDYSDEEMIGQFDVILRDFCASHDIATDFFLFTSEAKREVALRYTRKNDVDGMRRTIEEICNNAMIFNEYKQPIRISPEDLEKYFPVLQEKRHLDHDYLETVGEIRKKCMVSSEFILPCLADRIGQLLEEHEAENDNEKKKILESKIVGLGNIRPGNETDFDLEAVERALSSVLGMREAKQGILDDLKASMISRNRRMKPRIFVGPPGVGKTSLCDALGLGMGIPVIKIPFNQLTDPREITGYPSSYKDGRAGLLGRIATKGVNSQRCIVIIDEFDKPPYKGAYGPFYNLFDQQQAWDEWYETFFDTSGILFVCTANDIREIPYTLRDRCEIYEIPSYTCSEQAEIARMILLPRLAKELGIGEKFSISEATLEGFIRDYIVSGGIRELELKLESILKRLTREKGCAVITRKAIRDCLGEPVSAGADHNEHTVAGVATALAVNSCGGSTFNIIAYRNHQSEDFVMTGLAKGSMAESVQYAMITASQLLGRKIEHLAIHLEHAGVEKDGPSAGITLLMSILSLETGIPLGNVAFTGELSPTGTVLPVGGVREKCIAAEKAGIGVVFLPKGNYERMKHSDKLDSFGIRIVPVTTVSDLIKHLFPSYEFADMAGTERIV